MPNEGHIFPYWCAEGTDHKARTLSWARQDQGPLRRKQLGVVEPAHSLTLSLILLTWVRPALNGENYERWRLPERSEAAARRARFRWSMSSPWAGSPEVGEPSQKPLLIPLSQVFPCYLTPPCFPGGLGCGQCVMMALIFMFWFSTLQVQVSSSHGAMLMFKLMCVYPVPWVRHRFCLRKKGTCVSTSVSVSVSIRDAHGIMIGRDRSCV